ncbi:uncharacterized protein [Clytia hemisphaerica]|uniref:uncharacterized protein n=1 Tax=Clytia hemisphaerica TaxID=252671 RepID=UPI0034D6FFAA
MGAEQSTQETIEIETQEMPLAPVARPATTSSIKVNNETDLEIEVILKASTLSEPEASKVTIKRKRVAAGTSIRTKCHVKPSLNKRDVHAWAYDRYGERLKINGQEKLVLDLDDEDIVTMKVSKRRN